MTKTCHFELKSRKNFWGGGIATSHTSPGAPVAGGGEGKIPSAHSTPSAPRSSRSKLFVPHFVNRGYAPGVVYVYASI